MITLSLRVLFITTIFLSAEQVVANLIGVDFGSSFIKATLVKPGKKFEIVENTASKRKTENMVSLGGDARLYGVDAFMEQGKQPKTTFSHFFRTFGERYDSDVIQKFKEQRFITTEYVSDDRQLVAFKMERDGNQDVLYAEELVGMMLQYIRMLAEKTAGERVDECVITVPSWFTYDQRLMIKEAAQSFAGMTVLQLVHENTAAAVLFGIDKVDKTAQNHTVMFYNMGGMDTEVSIFRYSHINFTEEQKRATPYMEILAETHVKDMGSTDVDAVMVNLLAEKFNALPERQGKDDVLNNVRASKRLQKEVVKIKEVLSANKQASVKIPELLDYVTLQLILERDEVDKKTEHIFSRVMDPVNEALEKAGLTIDQIDQIELLGGGIRTPKVTQILEESVKGKELSVHLNGDEAMCFGSAFIGSNSTTSFKVGKVLLTQNPDFDIKLVIKPVKEGDVKSEEDQRSEGLEDNDIVQYSQTARLFNSSDYFGKSKAMTMNYDADMRIELFKIPVGADIATDGELLDTFLLDDLAKSYGHEVESRQKEAEKEKERKKKKAEKEKAKKNETESEDKKEEEKVEEKEEETKPIEKPKLRFSIELSRSGYMRVTKASIGGTYVNIERVRKPAELSLDQIKEAKQRLKAFKKRDEDKQRNDVSRNDFEALVYKVREWLREEENEPYVVEEERESRIAYLNEMEDWLYEDGAEANYTVMENKTAELQKDFDVYTGRKNLLENLEALVAKAKKSIAKTEEKTEALKDEKVWITEDERNDVLDSAKELTKWLDETVEKQSKLAKHETPVFDIEELKKKLKKLNNLFNKVSSKKAPKPKKEKKKPKEDNSTKSENATSSDGETETKEEETDKQEL